MISLASKYAAKIADDIFSCEDGRKTKRLNFKFGGEYSDLGYSKGTFEDKLKKILAEMEQEWLVRHGIIEEKDGG